MRSIPRADRPHLPPLAPFYYRHFLQLTFPIDNSPTNHESITVVYSINPTAQIEPCSRAPAHQPRAPRPPQISAPSESNTTTAYDHPPPPPLPPLPKPSDGGFSILPSRPCFFLLLCGNFSAPPPRRSGRRLRPVAVAFLLPSPPRFLREGTPEPVRFQRRSNDAATGRVQGLYGGRSRPRRS